MTAIIAVEPPADGIWRVGRTGPDGHEFRRPLRVDDTNPPSSEQIKHPATELGRVRLRQADCS